MTKLDEIRQKITELRAEARIINDNPNATLEEIQGVQNRLKIELEREKNELLMAQNKIVPEGKKHEQTDTEKKYKKAFYNMMRNKVTLEDTEIIRAYNKLSSTEGTDGGFLIPQDQMTKINELKKERFSFRNYINNEPVSTKTGSRVIEKNADEVPFTLLAEGDTIPDVETPQFSLINYDIKDYAGILPVPNNLLNDTDMLLKHI
nr:phage major capsid protein [Fusobacterium varium]